MEVVSIVLHHEFPREVIESVDLVLSDGMMFCTWSSMRSSQEDQIRGSNGACSSTCDSRY